MMKLACLALIALGLMVVSETQAAAVAPQAGPPKIQVVPMAATLCKVGCPVVCKSFNSFCAPIPGVLNCDDIKTQCDGLCSKMCTCITNCGPGCDVFEANCLKVGVDPVKGAYCPVVGTFCDLNCVISCPMKDLSTLFSEMFSNTGIAMQAFISKFITSAAKGLPQAIPAA